MFLKLNYVKKETGTFLINSQHVEGFFTETEERVRIYFSGRVKDEEYCLTSSTMKEIEAQLTRGDELLA